MTQCQAVDLVIIGGGMVGMTLAAALRHSGLHIVLIERQAPQVRQSLGIDCRVSAIVRGNVDLLEGIGVWEHLKQTSPIASMRIWDDQHDGGIRFDALEIGRDCLGMMVENSHLVAALRKVLLRSDGVELCCPAKVVSVEWQRDAACVTLEDGQSLRAPLVVGADGAHSWLRKEAGIAVWSHDFRQQGIVATIRPKRHHQQVAYQRFLPTGPLALLPMADGLCSMVWSAGNDRAQELMALDDDAFLQQLNLAFGPQLGQLQACGSRAAFPLKTRLAKHLVRPRLALIGDAAHTIHPLAGLGVNLGLRDAMVLAREISDAHRFDEDYGDMEVLAQYRNQRLPDVLAVMASMEGMHHLFTSTLPGIAALRGLGLRMVGNSGPIKQLLMRNSSGLTLPVPRTV